jgi:predicted metal-binding protein
MSQTASRLDACRLVVCRGCCCGTTRKHPGIDHGSRLARLRQTRDRTGRRVPVLVTECLGPCAEGDIIVVHPCQAARRTGTRPVWLGLLNDDDAIDLLTTWVADGGPGVAVMPDALELHRIRPAGLRTGRR